jgi:hypothetical protein
MKTLLLSLVCALLSMLSLAQNGPNEVPGSQTGDTTIIERKPSARKVAIKLYPNPSFGKVSVSAVTTGKLNFYVFDLEGTLIYQAVLSNKERKRIENLQKGTYVYDVFQNDESVEEGRIIIR